jgi:hypothetical protein
MLATRFTDNNVKTSKPSDFILSIGGNDENGIRKKLVGNV